MPSYEYRVIKSTEFKSDFNSDERPQELEDLLNKLASDAWRVVPTYVGANGCWLLMEREKKVPHPPTNIGVAD